MAVPITVALKKIVNEYPSALRAVNLNGSIFYVEIGNRCILDHSIGLVSGVLEA